MWLLCNLLTKSNIIDQIRLYDAYIHMYTWQSWELYIIIIEFHEILTWHFMF